MKINYYAEVFSTSGYGTAARAYVHALSLVGIDIAITAPVRAPDRFEDELISSLVGQHPDPDFYLVHAIPIFWPRWAYTTPNVVAITVWEADPIPQMWLRQLKRAADVWVPCDFNVGAFEAVLGARPFVLPYPLPTKNYDSSHSKADPRLGLSADDFVFYSIFDWQHRKNPEGMVQAFLKAFTEECDAVLLLKTIPGAATDAHALLNDIRSQSDSKGRVVLCCEALDDASIDTLHDRGNCYVSLHRGEGWGYPLFEAAARGTPTVASAQGGPLDFLDSSRHRLVHCAEQTVQKPYFLFTRQMRWSEPDIAEAAAGMRWVYEHREKARADAAAAAVALRAKYSLARVAEMAKARLSGLLAARSESGAV